jgi:alpha-L-rhamnosidase
MARDSRTESWTGLWIWGSADLAWAHRNEYIRARKTVTLPAAARTAVVRVTADTRYQLFVNGQLVGRGPARCYPQHQAFDEFDLAPLLRRGRNVIAALAHHVGESTFQTIERGGWGFLLDGEVRCTNGKRVPLHTNETWKAKRADAYNSRTTRYCVQQGFQEDFDAARDDVGWTMPDYDDRNWPGAQIYGIAHTMPYESFEPRGIPQAGEADCFFAAVLGPMLGRNGPDYARHDNIGLLLADEKRIRSSKRLFDTPEAALRPGGAMTVRPTPKGQHSATIFDAGHETAGYLQFDLEARGGEIIDFFFFEHVRPNGDPVLRPRNAAGMCYMADRYRCRRGRQQHRFFAWKGFRYVLAVFRDVAKPLKLRHITYRFTSYPVQRRGSFACSDPLLNRIWEVGAWTQQLCMHDAYMDCPWREQAQWWGDARVQWRVNQAAFGDAALFKRGLRQAAQSQTRDGLTYGLFPCECHQCILPDYTLVWVASLWDYFAYTGDDTPIREHFDAVERALGWFARQAGRGHLLGAMPRGLWLFLDWAPLHKGDSSATFNLQYLEALRLAANMAARLGLPEQTARYRVLAQRVEQAVVRAFWDAKQKVFRESYCPRTRQRAKQIAQHGNSSALRLGLQWKWHESIAEHGILPMLRHHDQLLARTPFANSYVKGCDAVFASPFFYAYVLEALFKAGHHDDALHAIRHLWGGMLKAGATSWYETWYHGPETYGGSSACHAWSASPTYHLSEQIGGTRPAAPGFDRVTIAPHAFDLGWADVTTPTRYGPIAVRWERDARDDITGEITLPKGITADVDWFGAEDRISGPGTYCLSTKE